MICTVSSFIISKTPPHLHTMLAILLFEYIQQAFTSNMEVSNYPMKARTQAELSKLYQVQEQREIEVEELQV